MQGTSQEPTEVFQGRDDGGLSQLEQSLGVEKWTYPREICDGSDMGGKEHRG